MWDVFIQSPRGRLSLRKFIVLLATILVAWFAYTLVNAPLAQAAPDAEIYYAEGTSGAQQIDYNDHTYSGPKKRDATSGLPGVPIGSTFFFAKTDSDTKLHVIYFQKGADYTKATEATHIVYDNETKTDDGPFINASDTVSLTISPRAPPADDNPGYTACDVNGGLGWVICPLTNTLASAMDYIYGIVASFLRVQPLATTSDQAMYRAWTYMRTFANLAFIAAFLVIIYSQITASGLGNYGIKKLLPRIIVAAILVNVSYWICAMAVDVSNILGYAMQDLFILVRNSLVGTEGDNWNAVSWQSMATLVLSGGSVAAGAGIGTYLGITALTSVTVGAGAALGGVYLLLPILLSVLFVVLITFLVLAARQALIVILIVLAPLAFVAYLLPNTEKWFERWRSSLFTLLLVFPAFSVIFGGSQLAAAIIIQSVLQKTEGGDPLDLTMIMLAMAVQVIPLAITPLLLKLGGGLLNRFAGVINNPTKGVFDRGKAWANERRDQAAAQGNRRIAGRVESGQLNRNRRFNAQAMAHRRTTGKMEREGRKSANEALSKGYFAQSADGRQLHSLNERAKLEQGLGDNENQANWNSLVRTSPGLRARSERSHAASSTAELDKKLVDTSNEEQWKQQMQVFNKDGTRNQDFNQSLFERSLEIRKMADGSKLSDDKLETAYSEMKSGNDPYKELGVQNLSSPRLKQEIGEIELTARKISLEGMRKASAETLERNNLTDILLKDSESRAYTGGVRGLEGADSSLATAVAKFRGDYNEKIQEKTQLMRHFNLSSGQRQDVAIGDRDVKAIRDDGSTYTFRVEDTYTREAMIEDQLKTGSFKQKEAIINASGKGGVTADYALTISQAVTANGMSKTALYWGAKTIDDISQNKYSSHAQSDAIIYHIGEGKISDEQLATQSPEAVENLFSVVKDTVAMEALQKNDPDKYQRFMRNYNGLKHAAWRIHHDDQLSNSSSEATRNVLKTAMVEPPASTS